MKLKLILLILIILPIQTSATNMEYENFKIGISYYSETENIQHTIEIPYVRSHEAKIIIEFTELIYNYTVHLVTYVNSAAEREVTIKSVILRSTSYQTDIIDNVLEIIVTSDFTMTDATPADSEGIGLILFQIILYTMIIIGLIGFFQLHRLFM